MTLMELLVVVSILVILAAITIPAARTSMEGRPVREASRAIGAYLSSARNRAMETGRPVGVMFERLPQQNQCCVVLRQCEIPPPYAGETETSMVQVQLAGYAPPVVTLNVQSAGGDPPGTAIPSGLVRIGDQMQLNHQGPLYTILNGAGVDPNGFITQFPLVVQVTLDATVSVPWPRTGPSRPVPYRIYRQAVPSAVAPLRLSGSAVVDLSASGTDSALPATLNPINPADRTPVIVMFSPRGDVERLYVTYTALRVTEPIYFLVGRWERMPVTSGGPPLAPDGLLNWQDTTNLWVGINARTGLIMSSPTNPDDPTTPVVETVPTNLLVARTYARQFQGLGGR